MKFGFLRRSLSLILVISMLLGAFSFSTFAMDNEVETAVDTNEEIESAATVNQAIGTAITGREQAEDTVGLEDGFYLGTAGIATVEEDSSVDWDALKAYLKSAFEKRQKTINISQFNIKYKNYNEDGDKIGTTADYSKLYRTVRYELSEFFIINLGPSSKDNIITSISPDYPYSSVEEYEIMWSEVEVAADKLLEGIEGNQNLTDVQKALLIHDRLASTSRYDLENYYEQYKYGLGIIPELSFTLYGILVNGIGVCMGYSTAYDYLLERVGIESRYCQSNELNHVWNIVTIDGGEYFVDVTWDVPDWGVSGKVEHDYFLCSSETFNHKADDYETISNTTFDNGVWCNSKTSFILLNDQIYYTDYKDKAIKNFVDNTVVKDLSDNWWIYTRLATDGTYLYYSSKDTIYRFDPVNDITEEYIKADLSKKKGFYVCGFTFEDGNLVYEINDKDSYTSDTKAQYQFIVGPNTCGDNLTWSYDNGTLTISGTRGMRDYNDNVVPWDEYRDLITDIVIEDDVTSIGDAAFSDLPNLVNVKIGESVQIIGSSAFENCTSIVSLKLPNSVKKIGNSAFKGCVAVTDVVLSDGLMFLADSAFSGCSSLTRITIPDRMMFLGSYVFEGCDNLKQITIPNSVTSFGTHIFGSEDKDLIIMCYPESDAERYAKQNEYTVAHIVSGKCGEKVYWKLSNGVLTVSGTGEMYNYGDSEQNQKLFPWYEYSDTITSVVIEKGVTSVGDFAFSNLDLLTNIAIGPDVQSIGVASFAANYSLSGVDIPDNVRIIGDHAFNGCPSLKLLNMGKGIEEIGKYAFSSCSGLSYVVLRDGVVSIGDRAFSNCVNLISVTVPDSVEEIGSYVFARESYYLPVLIICSLGSPIADYITSNNNQSGKLKFNTTIVKSGVSSDNLKWYLDDNGVLAIYGNGAMYDYEEYEVDENGVAPWYEYKELIKTVIIGNNVTSIGEIAFCNLSNITSVTIGNGVEKIGKAAFAFCTSLTSIEIPGSVSSIGNATFNGCTALSDITLNEGLKTIGDDAFSSCVSLAEVLIPNGVTSIGNYAFAYCTALDRISIPYTVKSIGAQAFALNDYYDIDVTIVCILGSYAEEYAKNKGLNRDVVGIVDSGVCGDDLIWLLTDSGELVITGTGNMNKYSSSMTSPWYNYKDSIQSIIIDTEVTTIGSYAFYECNKLVSVTIPDNVVTVGNSAFSKCTALINVKIGTGLTILSQGLFSSCENLNDVIISDTVTRIESSVFAKCSNLKRIVIPDSIDYIGDSAFLLCKSLSEVVLSKNASYIGSSAFSSCYKLKEIEIPYGVAEIKASTFFDCISLTKVSFAGYIKTIGMNAFQNCRSIALIELSDSVTSISHTAFVGSNPTIECSYGSYAHKYAKENYMDYDCTFNYSDNLQWNFNDGVLTVSGFGKMCDYGELEEDVVKLTPWNQYKDEITSIVIENSVTSIGNLAFSDLPNLVSVAIGKGVTTIGEYAFANCSSLESIKLPENVTYNSETTFKNTNVTIVCMRGSFAEQYAKEMNIPYECKECGKDLDWTLEDGLLTISGTGEMYDFEDFYQNNYGAAPWYENALEITKVVIGDEVTTIGDFAFAELINCTEVVIGKGVTSIGEYAFAACDSLKQITISDNVTNIKKNAFYNTDVEFICSLGSEASKYAVQNGITWKYTAVEGTYNTWTWVLDDGVLTITGDENVYDSTTRNPAPWTTETYKYLIKHVVIEEGITTLGNYLFKNCTAIESVELPASLTEINNYVFQGCTSLKEVILPDNVTRIGSNSFSGCKSLENFNGGKSLGTLSSGLFKDCSSLRSAKLPYCTRSFSAINLVFSGCDLTNLTIICAKGSFMEYMAKTDGINYESYLALDTENYNVTIYGAENISYIRYALGEYDTASKIKNAEGAVTHNAKIVASKTTDNVYIHEVANGGTYSFWVKYTDGTEYIEVVDVTNMTQSVAVDGVNITVNNLYGVRDFFIAKGEYDSYSEIKENGYVVRVTDTKINGAKKYTYPVKEEGTYTVLVRYNDAEKADRAIKPVVVDVEIPTYTVNGLQINVGNLNGVKAIRTAYGEYNTVSEIKKATGYRTFTQTVIKGSDEYTIQYRESGVVTVAVQYTNGYTDIVQLEVTQKESTMVQEGNTVTFGNLEGLQVLRYAEGEYETAAEIKRAVGSIALKADKMDENGNIVITLAKAGTYTFCVQYLEGSFNYYTVTVE